jgi:pyruvate dehydrogenase E2 component (dihydrolipoamide acetyltransferase)
MVEGEVVRWLVKEGDEVKEGDPLVELRAGEVSVQVPAPFAGVLVKLLIGAGERARVGQTLAILGEVLAAPAVRRRAQELGIDLAQVKGSGPQGRVEMEDLEQFAPKPIGPIGDELRVPLRKAATIEPLRQTAPALHIDEADVSELVALKTRAKPQAQKEGVKLTYLPFIIKASVAALKRFPYFNAQLDEARTEVILKRYYNIGIAVATPEDLVVPVIKDADEKPILEIARQIQSLSERAQKGELALDEAQDSTFSIINVGSIRGLASFPVINYPEVATLGLGRIKPRPVARNDQVVVRQMLYLSLSFDHRVANMAMAARFMGELIRYLEAPDLLMLEGL